MTDYGSGTLGAFKDMGHGIIGNWGAADVGVIGDSITTASWPKLRDKVVAAGKTFAVNYWSGRPFAGPGGAAEWLMQQTVMPKRLIVACGTNDIFDPPAFRTALWEFITWMQNNHPDTVIYWVDTQIRRNGLPVAVQFADQMNCAWVNQSIHSAYAHVDVIGWSAFFMANKNRLAYYLKPDGVHPTTVAGAYSAGVETWAAVIWGVLGPDIT